MGKYPSWNNRSVKKKNYENKKNYKSNSLYSFDSILHNWDPDLQNKYDHIFHRRIINVEHKTGQNQF
jgi:hypothetical protein